MWLWLSAALILFPSYNSMGAPTSLGPTSKGEAQLLLKEGRAALRDARYQDAENYLKRLVDRYPGDQGYLEAHNLLGTALVRADKPKEAVPLLKDYISATGANPESAKARLLLGHAFLDLNQYEEAHLIALEIEIMEAKTKLTSDIKLEALLIKSRALLGLKHEARAINALEAAEKELSEKNSAEVRGRAYVLHLQLKTLTCARFPSAGSLTEAQTKDQFERRGTCLLEAVLLFRKILESGDETSMENAVDQVSDSYHDYLHACGHPPASALFLNKNKISNQKPSALQRKRYQSELTDVIVVDCRKKSNEAIDLLQSWRAGLSDSTIVSLVQVTKNIEKSISGTP
jgi:tetratricopeptide (TPR) repeat protein